MGDLAFQFFHGLRRSFEGRPRMFDGVRLTGLGFFKVRAFPLQPLEGAPGVGDPFFFAGHVVTQLAEARFCGLLRGGKALFFFVQLFPR